MWPARPGDVELLPSDLVGAFGGLAVTARGATDSRGLGDPDRLRPAEVGVLGLGQDVVVVAGQEVAVDAGTGLGDQTGVGRIGGDVKVGHAVGGRGDLVVDLAGGALADPGVGRCVPVDVVLPEIHQAVTGVIGRRSRKVGGRDEVFVPSGRWEPRHRLQVGRDDAIGVEVGKGRGRPGPGEVATADATDALSRLHPQRGAGLEVGAVEGPHLGADQPLVGVVAGAVQVVVVATDDLGHVDTVGPDADGRLVEIQGAGADQQRDHVVVPIAVDRVTGGRHTDALIGATEGGEGVGVGHRRRHDDPAVRL